jgi:phage-related protein
MPAHRIVVTGIACIPEGRKVLPKQRRSARSLLRLAYTVRFEKAVYVLHCFQKKSPSGVRTARTDVELIHERLKAAREDYEVRYAKKT